MSLPTVRQFFYKIMVLPLCLMGCHMGWCADGRTAEPVWGDVAGGAQMSVSIEQGAFAVCHPVLIQLVLRNVSDGSLSFVVSGDNDFSFTVLDEKGKEVPLTRYGAMIQDHDSSLMRFVKIIAPGDEVKWLFTINRFHDMTLSGTYVVAVRRRVFGQDFKRSVEVASNPLKVVVKADAPAQMRGDK